MGRGRGRGRAKRKRRCHDRDYANWPRNLAKARFRRCLADHPLPSPRLYNRIPLENIRQPVNVRLQLGITLRSWIFTAFAINLDPVEEYSIVDYFSNE